MGYEVSRAEVSNNAWRRRFKNGIGAAALTSLFAFGSACDNNTKSAEKTTDPAERQAQSIERTLNNHKIAKNLIVEVGYELPVNISDIPGAVRIANPLKLGENIYGFMKIDHDKGTVDVRTVHTTATLKPDTIDDDRFSPHEADTTGALVYHEYPKGGTNPAMPPEKVKYYSVVMNAQPGDEQDQISINHSLSEPERQAEFTRQAGIFARNRIGDLVYSGK